MRHTVRVTHTTASEPASAHLSLSSELFLLLTKDSGRQDSTSYRQYALVGAVLAELLLQQRISLDDRRDPRVQVISTDPTGDPVLDQFLPEVERLDGTAISRVMGDRRMDPTEAIGGTLASAGILEQRRGLFGSRWPVVDPQPEQALRERIARSVRGEGESDSRDAILVGLLDATQVLHAILRHDLPELSRRELSARAKELIETASTPGVTSAVAKQIRSNMAAMMASMAAITAATTATAAH